jgi:uncharacterized membrane protein YdcZ (DUF606 family)
MSRTVPVAEIEGVTGREPRLMQAIYILITIGVGITSSLQIAMLGGINRQRGPFEATWISMLASIGGMAVLLGSLELVGSKRNLPRPFDDWWIFLVYGALALGGLVLAQRGLPPYLALTGFLPIPYLIAASYIGPRIGLGVYLAAIITGQMVGAAGLDQIGAFGATPRPIDGLRAVGIVVLVIGVLLVRGR